MERPFEETAGETEVRNDDACSEPMGSAEPMREPAEPGAKESQDPTFPVAEELEAPVSPDLKEVVAGLNSRLEESQRLLARQCDLVDLLHAENRELRAGEVRNAQLPLIRDLVRLHDDVGRMREAVGERDNDLRILQESLIDILSRNGVETYAPGHGEPFDPRFHAAAGTEPTAEKSLDKSVVEIVRHGFRWDSGDVIRAAEVRAYRYRDAAQASGR